MHRNSSSERTGSIDAYTVASMVKASEVVGVGHILNFCASLSTHPGKCKCFGLAQFFFFITKS